MQKRLTACSGPKIQKLIFLKVEPEIVDVWGSKRPPASPKPKGKVRRLRPSPFPLGKQKAVWNPKIGDLWPDY